MNQKANDLQVSRAFRSSCFRKGFDSRSLVTEQVLQFCYVCSGLHYFLFESSKVNLNVKQQAFRPINVYLQRRLDNLAVQF